MKGGREKEGVTGGRVKEGVRGRRDKRGERGEGDSRAPDLPDETGSKKLLTKLPPHVTSDPPLLLLLPHVLQNGINGFPEAAILWRGSVAVHQNNHAALVL